MGGCRTSRPTPSRNSSPACGRRVPPPRRTPSAIPSCSSRWPSAGGWMTGVLDLDGLAAMVQRLVGRRRRRPGQAHRRLCRARTAARPALAGAGRAPGPAGPRGQPDPLRALPRSGRDAALRRGLHRPPDLLPALRDRQALAQAASGADWPAGLVHRPTAPTLAEEFRQAVAAIQRGRDALDGLAARAADRGPGRLGRPLDRRWCRARSCWPPGSATTPMAAPISAGGTRCGCG